MRKIAVTPWSLVIEYEGRLLEFKSNYDYLVSINKAEWLSWDVAIGDAERSLEWLKAQPRPNAKEIKSAEEEVVWRRAHAQPFNSNAPVTPEEKLQILKIISQSDKDEFSSIDFEDNRGYPIHFDLRGNPLVYVDDTTIRSSLENSPCECEMLEDAIDFSSADFKLAQAQLARLTKNKMLRKISPKQKSKERREEWYECAKCYKVWFLAYPNASFSGLWSRGERGSGNNKEAQSADQLPGANLVNHALKEQSLTWVFKVLRAIMILPAVLGTLYFIVNIVTIVDGFSNGGGMDLGPFGVLIGGLLLTAIANVILGFIKTLTLYHYQPSSLDTAPNKALLTVNKTLYVIRLIFVSTVVGVFSIGFLFVGFFAIDDFDLGFGAMSIALGVAGSAAWIGYLAYGILALHQKHDKLDKVETISTIIAVVAWLAFGVILSLGLYEESISRPHISYTSLEILAWLIIIFGPLIYVALRLILRRLSPGRYTKKQHLKPIDDVK
ncbi:MAG: hypothetical protein FWE41_01255 [Coriobacteriia bacterium]|nr:hypothetical protein [Coriobacteriia bacterium]MCL2749738.1 hypothetical protein [Coriobacteriia bacterium]